MMVLARGGGEDAGVQDPILFGPSQFLAVEEEHGAGAVVHHGQLWNGAAFVNFPDFNPALLEGIDER